MRAPSGVLDWVKGNWGGLEYHWLGLIWLLLSFTTWDGIMGGSGRVGTTDRIGKGRAWCNGFIRSAA